MQRIPQTTEIHSYSYPREIPTDVTTTLLASIVAFGQEAYSTPWKTDTIAQRLINRPFLLRVDPIL